jgi:hypothetical protein
VSFKYFNILFFYILFIQSSHAIECSAWTRDENKNLKIENVTLSDLETNKFFSGKYFKIVLDKSETAVSLDDANLSVRACTLYYHLTLARNYFLEQFSDTYLKKLKPITIRIEMPYSFIDSSHYMHEDFKSYNNSLTIPPSNNNKLDTITSWDFEIWFAPAKKIKIDNSVEQAAKLLGSSTAQESLRLGVFSTTASNFVTQLAQGMTVTSFEGKLHVQSLLLSLSIVTFTPWLIEKFAALAKRTVYLDTALIPEVIYHEFAHIALSKHLKLTHHSPIVEGMANYFAVAVGNSPAILHKTKSFARGLDKLKVSKDIKYESWMEDQKYAQYGFVLALLGEIKKQLGNTNADKLIYHAHTKLNASSSVAVDLTKAIQESAREIFSPEEQKIILLKLTSIWQNRSL